MLATCVAVGRDLDLARDATDEARVAIVTGFSIAIGGVHLADPVDLRAAHVCGRSGQVPAVSETDLAAGRLASEPG